MIISDIFLTSSQISIVGLIVIIASAIFTIVCYTYQKEWNIGDIDGVAKTQDKNVEGYLYAGIIFCLHFPLVRVEVFFEEINGRDVVAEIFDFVPMDVGHHSVLTYCKVTGKSGIVSSTLTLGTYDIHFISTDQEPREVKFKIKEKAFFRPFEKFTGVGLTLLTIGFVLLVAGF
ncbi:MAG: hypothetical protein PHD13_03105 [Methanocellales archaeon]|nr:hypothetical protein [Methanocellales archaeon]MDD3291796.1 hypothetical protein [Methanocellales archaeon]MDD5235146.1 hypothetical protein [Methanocellales archaeon]MDD5485284.1 hypothetical protein [Methanocellales archaeon]